MGAPFRWTDAGAANSIHFTDDASGLNPRGDTEASGLLIADLDAGSFPAWSDCWQAIGASLGFPDETLWYAQNPNAFLDWMTDLSWRPSFQGVVVVLRNCRHLWAQYPFEMGLLVEVWLRSADYWASSEVPCHLIFELRDEPRFN